MEAAASQAQAGAGDELQGKLIIDAIKAAGISHVLSVPDLHTSQGLLKPISEDGELELIRVCKEDECLGIAAGLSYGNRRALILIQYTGFLYAMNAIRAVACEHRNPICLMIGMLGKEKDVSPRNSRRFGLRLIEPFLDTMAIPHTLIETDADVDRITPAIEKSYAEFSPTAMLIGRRPVA